MRITDLALDQVDTNHINVLEKIAEIGGAAGSATKVLLLENGILIVAPGALQAGRVLRGNIGIHPHQILAAQHSAVDKGRVEPPRNLVHVLARDFAVETTYDQVAIEKAAGDIFDPLLEGNLVEAGVDSPQLFSLDLNPGPADIQAVDVLDREVGAGRAGLAGFSRLSDNSAVGVEDHPLF